jgi:hypothetical protein
MMSGQVLWNEEINTWKSVSVESYQFVLGQAKERLDEVINEARTITTSGMKILLVYVTTLPGLAGYIFSGHNGFNRGFIAIIVVSVLSLFAIYIFTLLISLIAPGRIYYKGSQPKDIFKEEIFIINDSQMALKNLLFVEINRIQHKIERIQTNNNKRINQYKSVLRVSLILVAVLVFALVKRIFSDPGYL